MQVLLSQESVLVKGNYLFGEVLVKAITKMLEATTIEAILKISGVDITMVAEPAKVAPNAEPKSKTLEK